MTPGRGINITCGATRVEGRTSCQEVFEAHKAQLHGCYEQVLLRSPGLSGLVRVGWTISSNGAVSQLQLEDCTAGTAELGDCIARGIRGWEFPKPMAGPVRVSYGLVFTTSDG